MLPCECKSESFKVNNDTFTFFTRILPDPLFNYVNSAERHSSWLISLCSMWWQIIFWSKFSCPSTTPINSSRSWTWSCQSAAPPHFGKWEKVCLAPYIKAAELEEDKTSFPGWVLGVCPGHLGLQRMRKQPKTVSENRNLCFSLRRMALLLAWAYQGQNDIWNVHFPTFYLYGNSVGW